MIVIALSNDGAFSRSPNLLSSSVASSTVTTNDDENSTAAAAEEAVDDNAEGGAMQGGDGEMGVRILDVHLCTCVPVDLLVPYYTI
mmetsp:Transcript_22536/g.40082  ORF Transcript_22536/g.40082 Transcript_22536/m.40082 type:complete len:86 (+) Transcript_22536:1612-1869(+)